MNHVVVIEKNKNGKIELTKEELEKMLNDAYNQGYSDRGWKLDTITYPNPITTPVWYSTTAQNGTYSSMDDITDDSEED